MARDVMKFFPCRLFAVLALLFLTSAVISPCNAQSLRHVQRSHGGHPAHNRPWATISTLQIETEEESVDQCRGKKYQWMLKINKRCRSSFGSDSHWDITRGQGDYCEKGHKKCITSYYVECCSRDAGPKKLKEYCKILDIEKRQADPACRFQPTINKINNEIEVMTKAADEVVNPKPPPSTPTTAKDATNTASTTITPTTVTTVTMATTSPAPVAFAPAPAESPLAEAAPSPALEDQTSVANVSPADSSVAASPAAAPVRPADSQHQEKVQDQKEEDDEKQEAAEADQKKSACERFVQASQRVKVLVDDFKKVKDLEEADQDLDPDLAKQVNQVLAVGSFLQGQQQPCQVQPAPKDADNDDGDDSDSDSDDEGDNEEAHTKNRTETEEMKTGHDKYAAKLDDIAGKEDVQQDLEIEDPIRQVVVVVHVKVFHNLSIWVTQMSGAIQDVETKVHPNGRKWWRYRYEYTMVEVIFMAISILILLVLKAITNLVDRQFPPAKHLKVYDFQEKGLYRVAFRRFLITSGCLADLLLMYWVFSYTGIFDWLAILVQEYIKVRCTPFLGISYYLTLTDVVMHLFGGFLVYELLIVQVIREIRIELATWRKMEGGLSRSLSPPSPRIKSRGVYTKSGTYIAEKDLLLVESKLDFDILEHSFLERIATSQVYGKALRDVSLHEFTNGFVSEEDKQKNKFYLYLTLYMGECVAWLCGMAISTWILIVLTLFIGAFICWFLRTDLLMFLIPLTVFLVVVLVLMYFASRRIVQSMLRTSTLEPGYSPFRYMTPRKFCQVVQVILFHVSYAYTRIIMSYDFFMEQFWIWSLVTVSFVVLYSLFFWVGAEVTNQMLACLSLPPYIPPEQLADHMKELHDWQIEEKRQKEEYVGWRGVK